MNKRTFIKSLIAAAIAPQVIASASFDKFKWKKTASELLYVINPDYINATYEMAVLLPPASFYDFILKEAGKPYSYNVLNEIYDRTQRMPPNAAIIAWPYRYDENMNHVPPFIPLPA